MGRSALETLRPKDTWVEQGFRGFVIPGVAWGVKKKFNTIRVIAFGLFLVAVAIFVFVGCPLGVLLWKC